MTSLDHLTSAFELLWETKTHLLRTLEGVGDSQRERIRAVHDEVAASRNRIEKLLIELQETPAAPAQPRQ